MPDSPPPSLTPRELRKFGLVVGSAFAVLGGISRWRGHEVPPLVLWTLAVLLIVPALVVPRALAPVERGWMAFAHRLGRINTAIILGILFYLVITPIGLVMRLFRDPMDRKLDDGRTTSWIPREPVPVDPVRYRQPF